MMKNIMKPAALLVLAGMGALALAGCSPSSGPDAAADGKGGTEAKAGKPVELNVMVMQENNGDETEKQAWESIVKSYTESHPGVKINLQLQNFPGVEQHRTWVTTQLIGGTAPDIFTTRYIWDQEDLKKGLLVDLTSYYKQKNDYTDGKTWEDIFPKPVLKQLIGDDQTYASVPSYVNSVRVLYNKDLFTQAGISSIPKTWNEFMAAQEKLKNIGVVPFAFPNSKPGDYNYSWSTRILTEELIAGSYDKLDTNKNGVIEINEYARGVDQGVIDIEKSPYKDVFPILKEWSKYWPKGFNGLDFDSAGDLFLRGKAAMVMRTGAQSKVLYESSARKFEMAAFPLPYLTKENHPDAVGKLMEIGGVPAGNMAIPKTIAPEKMSAAVDFLAYTTSPKVQGLLGEKLYRTPVISNAALPDKLQGFQFVGETMQLNIYAGEVDKNVTENNQKLGQLYLEGSTPLEKYVGDLKKMMVEGVKKKMEENKWSKDNNYGLK
ncbi:ABC transporter substrate-binding protein [Paenibacillus thalictri]|nr:extracellular solute-binding protein [Paenibacillus thalictri]